MKRILTLSKLCAVIGVAYAFALAGCADSTTAAPVQTVDAGCAMCIYKIEGSTTCETAIKLDGKAYLVEGGGLDAHAAGLCSAEKKAEVIGKLEGGKFIATSVKLK